MRIAYVCADRGVPVFGQKGASVHVQEVIRPLRAAGAKVVLFATRKGGDPPADLQGLKVRRLPRPAGDDPEAKERSALEANDALCATLEERGPFDLVYERHSLWSFAGMEYAREHGTPGVLEVNAPLLEEQRRYRVLTLRSEAKESVARAYGAASALLAVSAEVGQYLTTHPAVRSPVHVVPNGVDTERFSGARTPAAPAPGRFTVGFVGTLKPWHGVNELIDAFVGVHRVDPNSRLLIVGDGPERSALEERADGYELNGAVEFTGPVNPAQIPGMLTSMNVAVAPYPSVEGFYFSPLKIFEYMAAARPVVAASIGQVQQLIRDEDTGLLYPPGDTEAMTAALLRLKASESLRRKLGEQARRLMIRDHTWASVAQRILKIAEACGRDEIASRVTP